jgi:hypothetical protein
MAYFGSESCTLSFHDWIADVHAAHFMGVLRGLLPLKTKSGACNMGTRSAPHLDHANHSTMQLQL